MRRRQFMILVGGAPVAWPLAAGAQQAGKVRRIGFLARTSAASLSPLVNSFRQGLRDLGWVEGNNISIEYQFGDGQLGPLGDLAAALVRLNVDVIVTVDTPPTQAAKSATSTIPIVIAVSADPVGAGLVESLAHPGGNITGLSLLAPDTDQKNLEIVKEALPKAARVAMIWDPNNRGMTSQACGCPGRGEQAWYRDTIHRGARCRRTRARADCRHQQSSPRTHRAFADLCGVPECNHRVRDKDRRAVDF